MLFGSRKERPAGDRTATPARTRTLGHARLRERGRAGPLGGRTGCADTARAARLAACCAAARSAKTAAPAAPSGFATSSSTSHSAQHPDLSASPATAFASSRNTFCPQPDSDRQQHPTTTPPSLELRRRSSCRCRTAGQGGQRILVTARIRCQ